ncbi:Uncharacterized protein APZ42_025623 [Daphnia magna]|uniref:Uncharacterized protein n=1 Tax=Daphnia magna TaxID=35525 RepID=A0A164SWJ1_9CRUS|nr:Uncharacterized protein APZ42_025623 [Daphnia magna]
MFQFRGQLKCSKSEKTTKKKRENEEGGVPNHGVPNHPHQKYLKRFYLLKSVDETIQKPDGDFTYMFEANKDPSECQGDASCQNEYPHGNVTTGQMLSTNFIQTKQPQREVMKKGHGPPNKEYKRIVANAPPSINEFKVTARETSNKLQTFKPLKGKKLRLRRDDLYNLYEMENSQKFIRHFVSFPDVIVVMYLDEL